MRTGCRQAGYAVLSAAMSTATKLPDVVGKPLGASSVVVERMHVVPTGMWQAAEPGGDYALVACFVAPGFEFEDFSMMSEEAEVSARLPSELRYLL